MGVTISTLDFTNEIKDKLSQKLGPDFILAEKSSSNYTLFKIDFDQSQKLNSLKCLADIIADIVIDKLEKKFINRIIKHKYQNFSQYERNIIQEMTLEHLNDKSNSVSGRNIDILVRKEKIVSQIIKYFNKNQDLNLEGFIRFRLKNYLEELKFAVEQAVDDFIIEKEYNEFIDLLKYFVDLQEPRISVVHVKQKKDGSFQILDKMRNVINNEYLEGYLADIFNEEVEYEDLLVSALINVASEEIILHFENNDIKETLKKIFSDRVTVCSGCELCEEWKKENEDKKE